MNIDTQKGMLYGIIFLLSFILLYKCKSDIPSGTQVEHYTDTVTFTKTYVDTNWFDTVRVRTLTKVNKINVYLYEDSSKIYRFSTLLEDSLLSGTIVSGIKIKDTSVTLVGQYIDYTPKFPKYIYKTDSVFTTIKDCTIVYDNKLKLLVGGNIDIGAKTTLTPTLGLQLKNSTYIEAGYNPFNKTILVGAKFKLF